MTVNPKVLQHPVTQDIPLPGFYPCLTTQLNLTTYQSPRTARFVIVTRDPSANVEIARDFCELDQYTPAVLAMDAALRQHNRNVEWLMGWRQDS